MEYLTYPKLPLELHFSHQIWRHCVLCRCCLFITRLFVDWGDSFNHIFQGWSIGSGAIICCAVSVLMWAFGTIMLSGLPFNQWQRSSHMKAALPSASRLATRLDRYSNTGPLSTKRRDVLPQYFSLFYYFIFTAQIGRIFLYHVKTYW